MKTILIIEDDSDTLRNLALTIEMEGFRVLTAGNGQAGLDLACNDLPDLILCDLTMPVLDGYDVLNALRSDARTSDIPFVFLTGRGERHDVRIGMNLGADDYLIKPVDGVEVIEAIHSRLARFEQTASHADFKPDFSTHLPLAERLNLTSCEAEVLRWIAQGKSNAEIGTILGISHDAVRRHIENIFPKLGVENRQSAGTVALEVLALHGKSTRPPMEQK